MLSSNAKKSLAEALAKALVLEDVMDEVIHVISEQLNPDDVFSESELEDWAESNGYEKY